MMLVVTVHDRDKERKKEREREREREREDGFLSEIAIKWCKIFGEATQQARLLVPF